MPAEDSSSASANTVLTILHTEWASPGILKVSPEEGPSFFLRPSVLKDLRVPLPESGLCYTADDACALITASRAFLAEQQALRYLASREHTRSQLTMKLHRKGYREVEIDAALGYLESLRLLDDRRFAEVWLRTRLSRRGEGPAVLLAGLMSRGVSRDVALETIRLQLEDTSEEELLCRAIEKLQRRGKTGMSLIQALLRRGFSSDSIRKKLKSGNQ